tara:strand:+ start:1095 stop:1349 length:255 start_codon:yes stop_codon:yes gene_type:complete
MLLYLETDLDNAYRIDCKERTKKDKPWVQREEFRGLYEELIELYIEKAKDHIFVDVDLEDLPGWVIGEVEKTLQHEVMFTEEEE